MKEYNFEWGKISYLNEDTICVQCTDDWILEADHIMDFQAVFQKEAENRKLKILFLPGQNTTATSKAREYSQNCSLNCIAEAIVVNSLAQRIISNFYISFKNKTDYPIKMFNSKEEAQKWLKSTSPVLQ